jgi:hypothetical protein
MSKDKKNMLTAADLGGQWRIRGKSGAAYVGTINLMFDNAIVIDQINGEKTIIFMDAIESMFEGIVSPKMQEELKEKEVEKEVE